MTTTPSTRLPENVRPVHYRLILEPDLDTFTFAGQEEVEVTVESPTSEVTLNASELNVSRAVAEVAGGEAVASAIEHDEEQERVTLRFASPLPAGRVVLRLDFTGELNDQLRGFYRSTYVDGEGVERRLATTQFEATDARRAFPCWDEPAVKASFDVTLVVPEELEAISNMPIASTEPASEGRKAVTFERTPAMSTYLLAFIVGDMACVEGNADDGTLVRVWATRG